MTQGREEAQSHATLFWPSEFMGNWMCFGSGEKARLKMQNSSDESLQLWAATYADSSPVTSFSAPHGVPVGWGQILPVAHQPSPGRRAPFEEFCSGKRTDCCHCLSQGLRPGKHLFFIQGLSPRPRAQLPQQGAFIGLEDRMGPSCGDPGGPDSQHLSLALPPR